jgi:hypothetical protein
MRSIVATVLPVDSWCRRGRLHLLAQLNPAHLRMSPNWGEDDILAPVMQRWMGARRKEDSRRSSKRCLVDAGMGCQAEFAIMVLGMQGTHIYSKPCVSGHVPAGRVR